MSTELSLAHFQELIRIDRKEERELYELELQSDFDLLMKSLPDSNNKM